LVHSKHRKAKTIYNLEQALITWKAFRESDSTIY